VVLVTEHACLLTYRFLMRKKIHTTSYP